MMATRHRSGNEAFPYVLDPDSAAPLYHQIRESLRSAIEDGLLDPGQMLPPERELTVTYGVNRLTLRQAVGELVHEGLLRREHGVGTFVARPKMVLRMDLASGFSELVREAGHTRSSRSISLRVVPARVRVADQLDIEEGAEVWRLQRLRLADDEPFMIETVYLSHDRFPGLDEADLVRDGLYRTLREQFGCEPADTQDTLEPVFLDAYERELLDTDDKTLGLLVEATTRDAQGEVVEFSKSVVRGDRSRYVFHSHNAHSDPTATAVADPAARAG
jgi:GntR family transcriptional regulator